MHILWPNSLILFGVIPGILILYIWILRRRRRFSARYSSLALVRQAGPQRRRWRRHIPFVLFLLGLGSLGVALGRPYSVVSAPTNLNTILLALDVSRSMCSADIAPSRIEAAESAAMDFIGRQKPTTQIGVVAFSGFAELVRPPTTDPELLHGAIESLRLGSTTAIGSAILKALDAIAEVDASVARSGPVSGPSQQSGPSQPPDLPSPTDQASTDGSGNTRVQEGAFVPDIIILLTDGVNNVGSDPLEAAQQAADRGVRVYTIGYGTPDGALFPVCPQRFLGNEPKSSAFIPAPLEPERRDNLYNNFRDQQFGYIPYEGIAGGGANNGFPRGIDEATLKEIAAITGGTYYSADSASQLNDVFKELPTYFMMKRGTLEVSVAFVAIGMLLAALAILLSLLWHPLG